MRKAFENSLLVDINSKKTIGKVQRQYVCSMCNTDNLDTMRNIILFNTDFQFTIDDRLFINIFLTEIREIHFIVFF